jgi:hypothetical protein
MLTRRDKLLFKPPISGCVLDLRGQPGIGDLIYDRSTYGNHGTITGATNVRLSTGLMVKSFDAASFIDCGTSVPHLAAPTLLAWIFSNAYETSYGAVITKNDGNIISLRMNDTNKHIQLTLNNASSASSDLALTNGQTYFIAATYDTTLGADNNKVYINGVLNGIATYNTALSANGGLTTFIGKFSWGSNWIGRIALPRILNRVLSATEIYSIYQSERHLFGVYE